MIKNLQLIKNSVLLGVVYFMLNSGTVLHAQTVITVEPGFNTLLDAVTANPGATFILRRSGDYVIDKEIVISVPTIIKGEKLPATDRPALVSYFANPGEGTGKFLFNIAANCTLQDVGLIGITFDEQQIAGAFQFTQSNELILDGCIFQGMINVIQTNGLPNLTIIEKNNTSFNNSNVGWDNWGGVGADWRGDNIDYQAYNNTYFTSGRVFNVAGTGPSGKELMEHNSYVVTWGDVFFPSTNKDYTVKNNIMYDAQVRGYVGKRYAQDGTLIWPGDYSDWKPDSLCGDVSIYPHLLDSIGGPRKVVVTNNLKMYSSHVLDFYKANKVTPMTFFNVSGKKFAAKYGWVIKNNMLQEDENSVDPQFAMGAIPDAAYTKMFQQRIERSGPAALQGPDYPYYLVWIPAGKTKADFIWPLPINLKPMNQALWKAGDDGFPLGDLNWFAPEVKAAWEAKQPNPLITSSRDLNKSDQSAYIVHNILMFKGFDQAVDVEVYSILGQKVLIAKNINEINVSSLIHGVYLVRVNNGNQAFRVVK